MPRCLLALGANLGDRRRQLLRALSEIEQLPHVRLIARSRLRETAAIGGTGDQPPFLNAAALITASLPPETLLERLHDVESRLGRQRRELWSARTIDLDLLIYGSAVVRCEPLSLPHPRMEYRRFVLEPACEAAPWMRHPTSRWTIRALLSHLVHGANSIAVAAANQAIGEAMIARIADTFELKRSVGLPAEEGLEHQEPALPTVHAWGGVARDAPDALQRPKLILGLLSEDVFHAADEFAEGHTGHTAAAASENAAAHAGTPMGDWRKILQVTTTGPIAWIDCREPSHADSMAIAAVQAVWPELASR